MMDSFMQKFIPPDLIVKFKAEYEKWIKVWNEKSQLDQQEHQEIISLISSIKESFDQVEQRIKNLEEKL